MRKLILTAFCFETPKGTASETSYRLVVVNHLPDEVEIDLVEKAHAQLTAWFGKQDHYKNSNLKCVQAFPTIGEDPIQVPDDRKVLYSEERLIAFGNTILERVERDVRPYVGKADRVDPTVFKVNASDLIDWKEKIKE